MELVRAAALCKCGQIGKIADGYVLIVLLFGRCAPHQLVVIEQ